MGLKVRSRVHIMPVGYEFDRIVQSAEDFKADEVILVKHDKPDEYGTKCLEEVFEWFQSSPIDFDDRKCDIFDLYDSLATISEAINGYEDDDVYVNLASGSKVTAIAGMIASVVLGATPYYVKANTYPQEQEDDAEKNPQGIDENYTHEIPPFPIDAPDEDQVLVMEFINHQMNHEGPPTKGEIIHFSQNAGLQYLSGGGGEKAAYRYLDSQILEPLSQRGYTHIEKHGKNRLVSLTDDGEGALEVFRWMVKSSIEDLSWI